MVAKDQLDQYAAGMHFRVRTGRFDLMDPSHESGSVTIKWDERRRLHDPSDPFTVSFQVDMETALTFPNGYQNYAEQAQFMANNHLGRYLYSTDRELILRFVYWAESGDEFEDDGTYVPPASEIFDWGITRSSLKAESDRVANLHKRLVNNRRFANIDPFEYEQ